MQFKIKPPFKPKENYNKSVFNQPSYSFAHFIQNIMKDDGMKDVENNKKADDILEDF